MKVLCIDPMGLALDWCLRCQGDGHKVRWFIKQGPKTEKIGRGLVEIVADWHEWVRWADLIFCPDNTRYLYELDGIRRTFPEACIVGPTQELADWEIQRTAGMKVFQKHGIEVPAYREFSDYDQAIAYVKREAKPFVSKPCGDEPDKSLSYVAKTPADLVYMLERWKKAKRHKGSFILQEKVDGVEMAVGGWFGPGGFNDGWHENWEHKKLFPGDMGPATGEQGTVMRVVKKSKLADKVLAPLSETLEKLGYCGYIDVNCIVGDDGTPWPLEFTMRPGWPMFNLQQALHEGDHAEWLVELRSGRDAKNFRLNEIATCVVAAIPDYPYSHITRKEVTGIPIYGLKSSNLPNIHPCEIMQGEAPHDVNQKVVTLPCWVTAGDYVLVASGTGETVTQSREKVYRVLGSLSIPNSPFWRTDIGRRLSNQLPRLQAQGYALGMTY